MDFFRIYLLDHEMQWSELSGIYRIHGIVPLYML